MTKDFFCITCGKYFGTDLDAFINHIDTVHDKKKDDDKPHSKGCDCPAHQDHSWIK